MGRPRLASRSIVVRWRHRGRSYKRSYPSTYEGYAKARALYYRARDSGRTAVRLSVVSEFETG